MASTCRGCCALTERTQLKCTIMALWAKVNYDALVKAGKLGETVFFMRSGFTGYQKYSTAIWAGDQNVDWSLDDGLASVIPAALSLGMSGYGIHTSDIGGYTTLYGMKRTKELFQSWTDFAIFTPIMRTHGETGPGTIGNLIPMKRRFPILPGLP